MKRILVINGSPRKKGNTAALLHEAVEGAESVGAQVEFIHLYELNFKGCSSCFACKRKDRKYNGKCIMSDDITEILNKVKNNDALILGSPIYLGDITGGMRSFLERLIFPNISYDAGIASNFEGKIDVGFIYTMNVDEARMAEYGYERLFDAHASYKRIFGGKWEYIYANDTYQFEDYSKYNASRFDEARKAQIRRERFPLDCRQAHELGKQLAK